METCEWEKRYTTGDMPWEKGEPSPGLVDFLARHGAQERATVLVPGCGTGHDVRAWARAGFAATGCDIAPSAIALCRAKTEAAKLEAAFFAGDFLGGAPETPFDWLFEHTLFCAINPARRPEYVAATQRWLKPGGHYLAVFYLIDDTDGPPFGTTRAEILERFSPAFDLVEEWVPRSYPNRQGLELMMRWRRKA